jgi:hypothetical protein
MELLADAMDACLQEVELRVAAVRVEQIVVAAVLDDAAGLQSDDAVGGPHRRQAVRNDEDGPVRCDLLHVLLNGPLALIVERARRFVEDEDARVGDEGPGYRDALPLAAGEARSALADDRS